MLSNMRQRVAKLRPQDRSRGVVPVAYSRLVSGEWQLLLRLESVDCTIARLRSAHGRKVILVDQQASGQNGPQMFSKYRFTAAARSPAVLSSSDEIMLTPRQ